MSQGAGRKTKHHRKPRSLGGKTETGNISSVTRREHQSWHTLFSNHSASEILEHFKRFYALFSEDADMGGQIHPPSGITQQWRAWTILFGNMDLKDMIYTINEVWLDPDYRLNIIVEPAERVTLKRHQRRKQTKQ